MKHGEGEFYRAGKSSYRWAVTTIEQFPYVSLSQWWFKDSDPVPQWCPSRKQLYVPLQAWKGLQAHLPEIDELIRSLPEGLLEI